MISWSVNRALVGQNQVPYACMCSQVSYLCVLWKGKLSYNDTNHQSRSRGSCIEQNSKPIKKIDIKNTCVFERVYMHSACLRVKECASSTTCMCVWWSKVCIKSGATIRIGHLWWGFIASFFHRHLLWSGVYTIHCAYSLSPLIFIHFCP